MIWTHRTQEEIWKHQNTKKKIKEDIPGKLCGAHRWQALWRTPARNRIEESKPILGSVWSLPLCRVRVHGWMKSSFCCTGTFSRAANFCYLYIVMLLVRARQFGGHLWETVWGYLVRTSLENGCCQQWGKDTRELVCRTSVEHNLEHICESGKQPVGHLWAKCGRHLWKHFDNIYGKQVGAHQWEKAWG